MDTPPPPSVRVQWTSCIRPPLPVSRQYTTCPRSFVKVWRGPFFNARIKEHGQIHLRPAAAFFSAAASASKAFFSAASARLFLMICRRAMSRRGERTSKRASERVRRESDKSFIMSIGLSLCEMVHLIIGQRSTPTIPPSLPPLYPP